MKLSEAVAVFQNLDVDAETIPVTNKLLDAINVAMTLMEATIAQRAKQLVRGKVQRRYMKVLMERAKAEGIDLDKLDIAEGGE